MVVVADYVADMLHAQNRNSWELVGGYEMNCIYIHDDNWFPDRFENAPPKINRGCVPDLPANLFHGLKTSYKT